MIWCHCIFLIWNFESNEPFRQIKNCHRKENFGVTINVTPLIFKISWEQKSFNVSAIYTYACNVLT